MDEALSDIPSVFADGRPAAEHALSTVVATRLRPPIARPGEVERTAVLDRIGEAPEAIVAVVAPGGYGKTTLLGQWIHRRGAPAAWISLAVEDNDPVVLLTSLATALADVVDVDEVVFRELAAEYPPVRSVGHRLANSLAGTDAHISLVLDDVHLVTNPACHDVMTLLAAASSSRTSVAIASREALPLPTARLRAEGRLVEVDAHDLAMSTAEARRLGAGIGRDLTDDLADQIVAQTEGWPAALYLVLRSAQSIEAWATGPKVGHRRVIIEYLRDEFLTGLDAETMQFLTRSAVLERMSGESCDAVLRTYGSAARLERYANSNLLVVPLDDQHTWYRYHAVLLDVLRSELEKREPELLAELRRRAAAWHETHGRREDAVEYALGGGDVDRAARLVTAAVLELYRSGRVATLERWFTWFDQDDRLHANPHVAVAGAWLAALSGHAAVAARRAAAAEAIRPRTSGDDGDMLDGFIDLLRATLCREGIDQARVDIERARRLLPRNHPWTPIMLMVAGVIAVCSGDPDEADRRLVESTELLEEAGAYPGLSMALAQRAELAMARDDRRAARSLAAAALDVVEAHHLEGHAPSAYVLAVAAEMAGGASAADRTRGLIARANRGRPLLNHGVPHVAVQARLALARAMLNLGDGAGARTVMREVDEIVRQRPGLGVLEEQVLDMHAVLRKAPTGVVGASSLTSAELRVLPLLQTHLTFREVGERLYVSPNTVKTHAISVYRKLGVSSRSEAVQRAVEIGLLEDWT